MKLSLLLSFTLIMISACGPERTQREKEKEQKEKIVEQQKAELAPLEGLYLGTLKTYLGNEVDFALYLQRMTLTAPNAGSLEVSKIPTLMGSFTMCNKKGACFKNGDLITDTFPLGQTNAVSFDSKTNELSLYFDSNTSRSGGSGFAATQVVFVGTLSNGSIKGYLSTTKPIGYLEVSKVVQPSLKPIVKIKSK